LIGSKDFKYQISRVSERDAIQSGEALSSGVASGCGRT
jgi:hypothetical protein